MPKIGRILKPVLLHGLLYGLALLTAAPFLWMILTSFKDLGEILVYPPRLLPARFQLDNYISAFTAAPFGRFYLNSLFVSAAVVAGQLVTCSLAAFAFARLKFPGRDALFMVF
ncbi:MAG: carbohydrate ABC transporter permease, partial [Ignavibacteria bacterium]